MNTKMMSALAALTVASGAMAAEKMNLNGAGGSFPAPLYQAWAYDYTQSQEAAKVNYQSVGSSAGVSQIKAKTIDFAGTDAPLSEADLEAAGLEQFHMVSGAVVPAVNLTLPAGRPLVLDGSTLAAIFLGEITRWNDPRIEALNPNVILPNLKITVVHRGDGSGTTHIFSSYLSTVSPSWKEKVGVGTLLKWPCGLAGQKNPGVCNNVRRIKGAIGYTEYTFALESKIGIALLKTDGEIVSPDQATWPILGKTYILTRKDLDLNRRSALQAYFDWCFEKGGETAVRLHYIPVRK